MAAKLISSLAEALLKLADKGENIPVDRLVGRLQSRRCSG